METRAGVAPRKETARIVMTPESAMKATVKLSNIQPSASVPTSNIRMAPVTVAGAAPEVAFESIPMSFCWAVLGVSAATLLIQLWTYFS